MKKHPWEKTTLIELNETWLVDLFHPYGQEEDSGGFIKKDKPETPPANQTPETPPAKETPQPGLADNLKQSAANAGNAFSNFYNGLSTPEKGVFWGVPLALAGTAYYLNRRRQQNNANSAAGYYTQQQYY